METQKQHLDQEVIDLATEAGRLIAALYSEARFGSRPTTALELTMELRQMLATTLEHFNATFPPDSVPFRLAEELIRGMLREIERDVHEANQRWQAMKQDLERDKAAKAAATGGAA